MLAITPESVDIVCPLISGDYLCNPVRVTVKSPKAYREAVYRIATFFRYEFNYDAVQYDNEGEESDSDHIAFLWIHPEAYGSSNEFKVPCIGACCFRLRESGYALQWIWFHPYLRRNGLLTNAWDEFVNEFGNFNVEPPLSDAMQAFLKKQNWDYGDSRE
jgi:hypothetical protein